MLKTNLLAITLTSLLSSCATNSPSQAPETPLITKAIKDKPKRLTTSRAHFSAPVKNTCDMSMTRGRRPIPIVDFESSVLDHTKGFLPNGLITCALTTDLRYPIKEKFRNYTEKGNFEGFDYKVRFNRGSIFLASSPSTAKWRISCKKDAMENIVSCSMTKKGSVPLFIHLGSDGESASFGLLADTYPNTEIAVKVGSNTKISASSLAGILTKSEIIEQMKFNSTLITSYYNWPYKVKKVDNHSIEGFSAALILMKKLHRESIFN